MRDVETMRQRKRTLLLITLVALLGVAIVVPPALAASSEVKLEIAEHCYFADWPCWNVKGNNPEDIRQIQPFTIAQGGTISFEDNEARYPTDVLWNGTAPNCTSEVPVTPPTKTNWSGTCTFANAGGYQFESQELFNDGTFDYTKYEVVVRGVPKVKTTPISTQHQTEATLTGSIEPEGNPTEYHFDYGSASVTEHASVPTSLGAANFTSHSVSLPVSGLLPGVEYHFELVVSYGAGQTISGGPQTFTTPLAKAPTNEPPGEERTNRPPAQEPTKESSAKESSPTSTSDGGSPATTATTSGSPSSGQPKAELASGPLFGPVEITSTQHGDVVHGSLVVSSAGAGGRLQIELFTRGATAELAELVRPSLRAGKLTFALPLSAKGRAALRHHRRAALTVKITLMPVHGAAVTVTRSVVVRA
jgi:hypothetical protein